MLYWSKHLFIVNLFITPMSYWRTARNTFLAGFAALAIGAGAVSQCANEAKQQHKPVIEVLSQVSLSDEEQQQAENFLKSISGANIENMQEVRLCRQVAQQGLNRLPAGTDAHFLQTMSLICTQIEKIHPKIQSIEYALELTKKGRASQNIKNHRLFEQLQEVTNGSDEMLGLATLLKYVAATQPHNFKFPVIVDRARDLVNKLEPIAPYAKHLSEQEQMALDEAAAKLVGPTVMQLQKLDY